MTRLEQGIALPEVIREQLKEPKFLPSLDDVLAAFPITDGNRYFDESWRELCWQIRKEHFAFHEFLTREHVDQFAEYLKDRTASINHDTQKPVTILEVAAGDGRLAHFLRQRFQKRPDISYIATDSGEWGIKPAFDHEPVEEMDVETSLRVHKPDIVICSWMPVQLDWSQHFRKTKSVQEYILIGETENGMCGDNWLTWGINPAQVTPPFVADGFSRHDLHEMQKYQICWSDGSPHDGIHSWTVSFRRNNS